MFGAATQSVPKPPFWSAPDPIRTTETNMQSKSPNRLIATLVFAALMTGSTISGEAGFEGELVLKPDGCQTAGLCTLDADFGFVDAAGLGWQAAKGLLTDGASIPPWAQPFVGQPFETAFIKAAVIHDHYCDRHVRPWRLTHKVFHEALLESGVSRAKAGIMYFAVMVGGPKWVRLIKGKPCPVGTGCINQFDISASMPGNAIAFGSGGELLMTRADEYGSARFANTMEKTIPELESLGDALTAEKVEEFAKAAMAEDFYFLNEDEVGTGLEVNFNVE